MQKLVPIDSKKKDLDKIKEDLEQGWVIANMMPYEDGFLCVLEKIAEKHDKTLGADDINIAKILASTRTKGTKKKKLLLEEALK